MRSLRKKDRKKIETKTWPDFWTKLDNFSQSVAVWSPRKFREEKAQSLYSIQLVFSHSPYVCILSTIAYFTETTTTKKREKKNKIEKDKNNTAMNQSVKPIEVRSQQDLKLLLWQYENNRSITSSWHEAFFGLYILIGMVAVFANGLVVIAVFRNKKVRSKIFYLIPTLILIAG